MVTGEVYYVHAAWRIGALSALKIWPQLFYNMVAAVLLNLISFEANRIVGAVAMTVCGNVKQVLTILVAAFWLNAQIGYLGTLGVGITLAGAFAYSCVEIATAKQL
jgi:hypothetical protein